MLLLLSMLGIYLECQVFGISLITVWKLVDNCVVEKYFSQSRSEETTVHLD